MPHTHTDKLASCEWEYNYLILLCCLLLMTIVYCFDIFVEMKIDYRNYLIYLIIRRSHCAISTENSPFARDCHRIKYLFFFRCYCTKFRFFLLLVRRSQVSHKIKDQNIGATQSKTIYIAVLFRCVRFSICRPCDTCEPSFALNHRGKSGAVYQKPQPETRITIRVVSFFLTRKWS